MKSDKVRIAHFVIAIGPKALDIHNGLPFKAGEDEIFQKVLDYWEFHCMGKSNVTYERYGFNTCNQKEKEPFDSYYIRLRKLVSTAEYSFKCKQCNTYNDLSDEFLKDRIVCGTNNGVVREQLLSIQDLNLDKCLDTCRAAEISKKQGKAMTHQANEPEVNFVKKKQKSKSKTKSPSKDYKKSKPKKEIQCKFCGTKHERKKESCPAWGQKRKQCKKRNHFEKSAQTLVHKLML